MSLAIGTKLGPFELPGARGDDDGHDSHRSGSNVAGRHARGPRSHRILGGGAVATNRPQYAVARDGRFLINQPVNEGAATPITLVLNWTAGLQR